MAGVSNKSKCSSKHFSYDIRIDGALLSTTRASLVIELVKYILYERQQIPLPVDELKSHVISDRLSSTSTHAHVNSQNRQYQFDYSNISRRVNASDEAHGKQLAGIGSSSLTASCFNIKSNDFPLKCHTTSSGTGSVSNDEQQCIKEGSTRRKLPGVSLGSKAKSKSFQNQKGKSLISDLNTMFSSVEKAFESCPEIEQVAVMLGGTVVTPKESYLIKFPPPCPDVDDVPFTSCKRALFRQIIGDDALGSVVHSISPTNMMLLISAPRSCPLKGFLPKQSLCSPRTGSIISFNFLCSYTVPVCHDLTFVNGSLEVSGIDFLEANLNRNNDSPYQKVTSAVMDGASEECFEAQTFHGGRSEASCIPGDEKQSQDTIMTMSRNDGGSAECGWQSQEISGIPLLSHFSQLSIQQDSCTAEDNSLRISDVRTILSPSTKFKSSNGTISHGEEMQVDSSAVDTVLSQTTYQVSDQVHTGTISTASQYERTPPLQGHFNKVKPQDTDCIWYQSPLVIKGYKNKVQGHSIF